MGSKPPKLTKDKVVQAVRSAVSENKIEYAKHALERMSERRIDVNEVETALRIGFNESRKDEYKAEFDTWIYSIRADIPVTEESNRRLRIPVVIEDGVLVVTAIDIDE